MSDVSQPPTTMKTNASWLKPEQVEQLRDAAHSGRHGQRDEAIVTILYDTGLQPKELLQVDRESLNIANGSLRISPRLQEGYSNDKTPNPATFELDPEANLRTLRVLSAH